MRSRSGYNAREAIRTSDVNTISACVMMASLPDRMAAPGGDVKAGYWNSRKARRRVARPGK